MGTFILSCRKHAVGAAAGLIILLSATGASARLTLFRYEDQAQRYCPDDIVVWLDFKKRKYYLRNQKLYGSGSRAAMYALRKRAEAPIAAHCLACDDAVR